MNESKCEGYDPDVKFHRFKVVEFPKMFVGTWQAMELDVHEDLVASVYLKTFYGGRLMKFSDAQSISASHRAFEIVQIDDHTIKITFQPTTECISWAKVKNLVEFNDRFVFDLRLIKVDGARCCNNEFHSEVGRFYISGEFEYCDITHFPHTIDFGNIKVNANILKNITFRNPSSEICAIVEYNKVYGYEVSPEKFTIEPNSKKKINITVKPSSLYIVKCIEFHIRYKSTLEQIEDDSNDKIFIVHKININVNIIADKTVKQIPQIISQHHLNERNPNYTYMGKELKIHLQKEKIAMDLLRFSKSTGKKPVCDVKRLINLNDKCLSDDGVHAKQSSDFCKSNIDKITIYDLLNIVLLPTHIEFGEVALSTYGSKIITIKNNTAYEIIIKFHKHSMLFYLNKTNEELKLKLKAFEETSIKLYCLGAEEGNYKGTIDYTVDNNYIQKHSYSIHVGIPTLKINEKTLKFGMVTSDTFVTSVPTRLTNNYNVPVSYQWDDLPSDVPFKIIPAEGIVPRHSCRICDVVYTKMPTKLKTYEIRLTILVEVPQIICFDFNLINRKIAVKFWQNILIFKDIPLNIEVKRQVPLENNSREIAFFSVVEPLFPGVKIDPKQGILKPKSFVNFTIRLQIACFLEFTADICVRINNKENVFLTLNGNVLDSKIIINPKYMYLQRIPSNMITYVPINISNTGTLRSEIKLLDLGNETIFNCYSSLGPDKERITEFNLEGGVSKLIYMKVYDVYRRAYDFYLPFQINGILGPPSTETKTTDFQYYIGEYEKKYENLMTPAVKARFKNTNKDITSCRAVGVITVPWIEFVPNQFEIIYNVDLTQNFLNFTMTNVSRFTLPVLIMRTKLYPHFTLDICGNIPDDYDSTSSEMKFILKPKDSAEFLLNFYTKSQGVFVSTAIFYLDEYLTTPYYNLTFTGRRLPPSMSSSVSRIVFPPCRTGEIISRKFFLKIDGAIELNSLVCSSKEEPYTRVQFLERDVTTDSQGNDSTTVIVEVEVTSNDRIYRIINLIFHCGNGAACDIDISFQFTNCPVTIHATNLVTNEFNAYPYFPEENQTEYYEHMERTIEFLEEWMYVQGFRRDLNPEIPDTFHVTSKFLVLSIANKMKVLNATYMNFLKRIAGPLLKNLHKTTISHVEDSTGNVVELYNTYKNIIHLLKTRGCHVWGIQANFLLSYSQYIEYSKQVTQSCNADIIHQHELLSNEELFNRITKQSWMDFILQTYRAFVLESCFFECTCINNKERDVVRVIISWYNDQIAAEHNFLRRGAKQVKVITNLTTDLSDGIALISAFLNYCPFLKQHFSIFCEIEDENDQEAVITNNACLIIEALNLLKINFPLKSADFFYPNNIQMLFLSIHLHIVLPMFRPRSTICLQPPLLKSSVRILSVFPVTHEPVLFNFVLFNNNKNNFYVEKVPQDNGKRNNIKVKYTANFVSCQKCILLIHGHSKTRIFDTYVVFELEGNVSSLVPFRKCRVTAPIYRPTKVEIFVASPFHAAAQYKIFLTDIEPTIPVQFEDNTKSRFRVQRLQLIEKEVYLCSSPSPKDQSTVDLAEEKISMQLVCLSTQLGYSWLWFRSVIGEFYIKVSTQPRCDLPMDTVILPVSCWPVMSCSCQETCDCKRYSILVIPNTNDLIYKAIRSTLIDLTPEWVLQIYDDLIENQTGRIILKSLFEEYGSIMSEVTHLLQEKKTYTITVKGLTLEIDNVTVQQHSNNVLSLPVLLPEGEAEEKFNIVFTSECGLDTRAFRVLITVINQGGGE